MLRIISPKSNTTPFARANDNPVFKSEQKFVVLPLSHLKVNDYIFTYAVHSIPPENWCQLIIEHVKYFPDQSTHSIIILDCSYEGTPMDKIGIKKMQSVILEHSDKISGVIYLLHNTASINAIKKLNSSIVKGVYFHSFLHFISTSFSSITHDEVHYKNHLDSKFPSNGKIYEKKFTCLMNRVKPHRIVIFGWLAWKGYLKQGNVSFHSADSKKLEKNIKRARKKFPRFNNLIDYFCEHLKDDLPFKNFEELTQANFITSFSTLPFMNSPMSLIVESEMTEGEKNRFTEKSLKPIVSGQLSIIAGNPHVISLLRQHDFKIVGFSDDYDNIISAEDRLARVFEIFDNYMKLDDEQTRNLVVKNWPVLCSTMENFPQSSHNVMQRSLEDLREAIYTYK